MNFSFLSFFVLFVAFLFIGCASEEETDGGSYHRPVCTTDEECKRYDLLRDRENVQCVTVPGDQFRSCSECFGDRDCPDGTYCHDEALCVSDALCERLCNAGEDCWEYQFCEHFRPDAGTPSDAGMDMGVESDATHGSDAGFDAEGSSDTGEMSDVSGFDGGD